MLDTPPEALSELLMRDIVLSENGIAVLDPGNVFLFHNQAFARMFGFGGQSMTGRNYDDMMTLLYQQGNGPRVEAPTLDAWLAHVHSRQRSAPFRSFEVDMVDGRWVLLSEQLHPDGEVVMLCTDITRQKHIELDLVKAHAALERLAHTDELTGMSNRRHFLQLLETELARARRYRHPLSLAMLDLDHFKRVNDGYGHPAGDEVLKHFAGFLHRQLRTIDVVGRLGGEEFAVLLPETRRDDAVFVLDRAVALLARETVELVAPGFRYTFSGGVATADTPAQAESQWLLASADHALYQSKTGGRNRVTPFAAG
jgi:diguanylate cyclase (GGDEF)-like protein